VVNRDGTTMFRSREKDLSCPLAGYRFGPLVSWFVHHAALSKRPLRCSPTTPGYLGTHRSVLSHLVDHRIWSSVPTISIEKILRDNVEN
jgi:hypothetical protein